MTSTAGSIEVLHLLCGLLAFAISLTARNIIKIGFMERPIAIGLCWALCTGDISFSLLLAIFFELFWLDLFPIGSYLPPMPAFPYILLMTLAPVFDWQTAQSLFIPLILCLPLAYVIPFYEKPLRRYQSTAYTHIVQAVEEGKPLGNLPGRLILKAGGIYLSSGLTVFLFMYGVLLVLLPRVQGLSLLAEQYIILSWPILLAGASTGAFLALRIPRAYLVFSCSIVPLGIYSLFFA